MTTRRSPIRSARGTSRIVVLPTCPPAVSSPLAIGRAISARYTISSLAPRSLSRPVLVLVEETLPHHIGPLGDRSASPEHRSPREIDHRRPIRAITQLVRREPFFFPVDVRQPSKHAQADLLVGAHVIDHLRQTVGESEGRPGRFGPLRGPLQIALSHRDEPRAVSGASKWPFAEHGRVGAADRGAQREVLAGTFAERQLELWPELIAGPVRVTLRPATWRPRCTWPPSIESDPVAPRPCAVCCNHCVDTPSTTRSTCRNGLPLTTKSLRNSSTTDTRETRELRG